MPLVEKSRSQRPVAKAAPPQYQVKIVGGRRVLVWKDGDNGLQQPSRSPPNRGQVQAERNPAIKVTPSGGGSQSQYQPVPLRENPHQVSADRVPSGSAGAGASERAQPGPAAEQAVGQSIVGAQQPAVSQTAARQKSDVTGGSLNTSFSVLPPISAGGQSGQSAGSGSQPRKMGELEEITLKNEIYRSAELIDERRVQRILNEMRTLDRDRDGVLEPTQVKRILHKHQLKFSPEVDENLLLKFGENPRMVRYEKLVQYLGSVKLEASRTIAQPTAPLSQAAGPGRLGRTFTERDVARLREDLAAYLRPRLLDLDLVTRTFFDLDRDRNDFLSVAQVETGLHRSGLSDMPQELMQRLCTATDRQGNGLCNIDRLTSYLTRATPGFSGRSTGAIQGLGNNHHPRLPKEPFPVNSTARHRPPHTTYQPQLDQQIPGSQLAAGPAPEVTPDPADTVPYDTGYPPSPPAPTFDPERWRADYQQLVNALYQRIDDGSGYMTVNEVGRITESYNTIYNLGIPFELVNRALSQATEPTYGMIQLSIYTDVLINLCLNSV